jgi:hypothetical protein
LLSSSVLKEEFFGDVLMGILSSEIDNLKLLLAIKSGSFTSCFKSNFKINTVIDDDMKGVGELLDFIAVADYFNLTNVVWLEDSVSLDDLPDGFFCFGESGVLGWDSGVVFDFELLGNILKHINILIIKHILISINSWSSRLSQDRKHWWNLMTFDLNKEWDSDIAKDFCSQGDVHNLSAVWWNDASFFVGSIDSNSLGCLILRDDFVSSLE